MEKIGFKIKNLFKNLFSSIKELHKITEHTRVVSALALLHDGRLASSSVDGTIKIFNLKAYKCEITINKENIQYPFLSVLNNGNILTSSSRGDILIYSVSKDNYELVHKITSGHGSGNWNSSWISVVIQISNNRIASGSSDKTIKIWNGDEPYNCISTLKGHTLSVCALLELKGKDLLVSGCGDKTMRIWSLITYQCVTVLNDVECYDTGGLLEIKGNRILAGGNSKITLVDIGKLKIEKSIKDELIHPLFSTCYVNNDKYIFGNSHGEFIMYNEAKNKIVGKIEKAHLDYIPFILRINDKMIASCSQDNSIKIWSI